MSPTSLTAYLGRPPVKNDEKPYKPHSRASLQIFTNQDYSAPYGWDEEQVLPRTKSMRGRDHDHNHAKVEVQLPDFLSRRRNVSISAVRLP